MNNMDLAKLKRAIDEMQSAKVPSKSNGVKAFFLYVFLFFFKIGNERQCG